MLPLGLRDDDLAAAEVDLLVGGPAAGLEQPVDQVVNDVPPFAAALGETKQARAAAERLLAADPDFYDANLASGIENYLLSLKSAPIRWVLQISGCENDRQEGIEKLRLTAEKGRLFAPFAKLLLAVAALRDKDRGTARAQLAWLAEHFPLNRLFREELAKVQ